MSTRERWIVYPLLLLTLGIVIRDKILPQGHFQANEVAAGRIHCGQLQVDQIVEGIAVRNLRGGEEFAAGKIHCTQLQVDRVITAGGLAARGIQCGELVITGQDGRPTVVAGTDPKTKGGLITTLSPAGAPLVLLQPTDSGGVVRAAQVIQGKAAFPEKPKTKSTPSPKESSKNAGKAPAKARHELSKEP